KDVSLAVRKDAIEIAEEFAAEPAIAAYIANNLLTGNLPKNLDTEVALQLCKEVGAGKILQIYTDLIALNPIAEIFFKAWDQIAPSTLNVIQPTCLALSAYLP